MTYLAGFNMPGYLPDNPAEEFTSSAQAMAYIKDFAFENIEATCDEAQALLLMYQVKAWAPNSDGEFGCTLRNYHYWVVKHEHQG